MGDGIPGPDGVELTPVERQDIDGMYLRLASGSYYELLGVEQGAERKVIRDAYFGLSQKFHPDVFFGRNIGPWKARIEEIFREATRAYDVLGNKRNRADYDAQLVARGEAPAPRRKRSMRPGPRPASDPPTSPAAADSSPPKVEVLERTATSPPRTSSRQIAAVVPTIDPEAARKAAREALARRMGMSNPSAPRPAVGPSTHTVTRTVTVAYGSEPRDPRADPSPGPRDGATTPRRITDPLPGARPPGPDAEGRVSALASMASTHGARIESERGARLARLLKVADEAIARKDVLGASNALAVARAIAPSDLDVAARADEAARRLAETMVEKNTEQARSLERNSRFYEAAVFWLKALAGKPADPALMVHAARAYLRANQELPHAAELARRATQLAPRSAEAHLVLAQVFQAGGLKASAISAAETALKLDPSALLVKDLLRQLKG